MANPRDAATQYMEGAAPEELTAEDRILPQELLPEEKIAPTMLQGEPAPVDIDAGRSPAFTNRPELAGQPGWTFVDEKGGKITPKGEVIPGPQDNIPSLEITPSGERKVSGEWNLNQIKAVFPDMFPKLQLPEGEKPAASTVAQRPETFHPSGITRDQFEANVFKQIGGNPFLLNPQDVAKRADKDLPKLFDQIFAGHATYADLPNLPKDMRDYWDKAKLQYHRQAIDQAKADANQMAKQYRWMMGKYDYDEKRAYWMEKKRAADLTQRINGKTITGMNPQGELEYYQMDPESLRYLPTGVLAKQPAGADKVPSEVTFAMSRLRQINPKLNPITSLIGALRPDLKMNDSMTPEQKTESDALSAIIKKYSDEIAKQYGVTTPTAPASAAPVVAPNANSPASTATPPVPAAPTPGGAKINQPTIIPKPSSSTAAEIEDLRKRNYKTIAKPKPEEKK